MFSTGLAEIVPIVDDVERPARFYEEARRPDAPRLDRATSPYFYDPEGNFWSSRRRTPKTP